MQTVQYSYIPTITCFILNFLISPYWWAQEPPNCCNECHKFVLVAHLLGRSSVANGGQHLKNPKIQAQKCRRRIYNRGMKILAVTIPPIMTSLSLTFITLVFYGAFRPVHGSVQLLIFDRSTAKYTRSTAKYTSPGHVSWFLSFPAGLVTSF